MNPEEVGTGAGRSARLRIAAAAALAICLTVGSSPLLEAQPPANPMLAADTLSPRTPGLFQRRVLFSPDHPSSPLDATREIDLADVVIEIAPPSEVGLAAAYARRYGISNELSMQIIESAIAEGVDPGLAFRLIRVESVFRRDARGPAGALGLTQLMPATARSIDRSLRSEAQILDPETNLRTGLRYLRRMLDMYRGDVRLALLAYNRGETAVNRALKAGRDPENGYSKKVLTVSGSAYQGNGVARRR
ncbi:MAG: transglycosylase SLT domain-containing protein [Gemmatimonadota bacterium]